MGPTAKHRLQLELGMMMKMMEPRHHYMRLSYPSIGIWYLSVCKYDYIYTWFRHVRSRQIFPKLCYVGNVCGARWWQLKHFLFSSLFGEDSHFDEHIFQMGWFNHQPGRLFLDSIGGTWRIIRSLTFFGRSAESPTMSHLKRFFFVLNPYTPPKQTWNLKMGAPWKRRFLLETIISRFHVNFW